MNPYRLQDCATCLFLDNDGQPVCAIIVGSLTVAAGTVEDPFRLTIRGDNPVIIVSRGDVDIRGRLNVSGDNHVPGPGGGFGGDPIQDDASCDGEGLAQLSGGQCVITTGGGGGGGHLGHGGDGACPDIWGPGGVPSWGCDRVSSIVGGSGGGASGREAECHELSAFGGGGGGWLQIFSTQNITIHADGRIEATGAPGGNGCTDAHNVLGGAGGGGAGGTIILAGRSVVLNGIIGVEGGHGGDGSFFSDPGDSPDGGLGGGEFIDAAGAGSGGPGNCANLDGGPVGSGGGGSAGRVFMYSCSGGTTGDGRVQPSVSACPVSAFE